MKNLKFNITGKSLNELYKIYGEGDGGFYSHWWKDESFANEKPKPGTYEINFERELIELNYEEQKKKLPKGFEFPHLAVIAEAILSHHKKTKKWLFENYYSRTSLISSGGGRVVVGGCCDGSVGVSGWGGSGGGGVGVGASRKLKSLKSIKLEPFDSLFLERLESLENDMSKLKKVININD